MGQKLEKGLGICTGAVQRGRCRTCFAASASRAPTRYGNMFQVYRDFEKEMNAARSIETTRKLNPALQNFDQWLTANKAADRSLQPIRHRRPPSAFAHHDTPRLRGTEKSVGFCLGASEPQCDVSTSSPRPSSRLQSPACLPTSDGLPSGAARSWCLPSPPFPRVPMFGQARPAQADPCTGARDLRLTNGRFVTMDGRGTTASEVTIQDGRFTAVGPRGNQRLSPCTREINLRGRTVVPGLIDNHNHIVLLGIRPGYHTPLEGAASIAEVQARNQGTREGRARRRLHHVDGRMESRRSSPRSDCRRWPSSMPRPRIIPCSCSRDSPDRPRPTRRGKEFLAGKGVMVSDTGAIGANAPSMAALNALRAVQTFEDRKRGTADAMAYSASVGVTTNVDMGAFNLPGTPDLQGSFEADTLASANQFRMYDAVGRAAPRRPDEDAAACVLPDDGYAARRADPVRAAAQRLQRLRRRHDAHLRHRRVRHRAGRSSARSRRTTTRRRCRASRRKDGRSSSTASRRQRTS